MTAKMTTKKLEKLFTEADTLMVNFTNQSGPFRFREVSHNLFNDFVTAARRDLKDIPMLQSDVWRLGSARDNNRERTDSAPALNKEQTRAVIVCSAALAAKLS